MENKVLLISCTVGFLGLLSAAAGFGAEANRIKVSLRYMGYGYTTKCVYTRSPAMALGLVAAFALMVAKIIINASTGCFCCKRNTQPLNSNWNLTHKYIVVSWIAFVIAFILLLCGAALNDEDRLDSLNSGNHGCYVVKPGVFAVGAILSLASVTLGILHYLTFTSLAKKGSTTSGGSAPNQGGIAMGQPQFP